MHSLQNATRCRDGVKELSLPSSLVGFGGFHPYKLFVQDLESQAKHHKTRV